ncbi:MAG: hypothetical protein Ct9H300mP28_26880 [Pseudomonadota bacterium]|nr:MAG: hypothetical protein Ct9H300mP28_26880 [Pseudomonadota bacterium]
MGKQRRQKGETKKTRRRQNVRVLVSITSVLFISLVAWYESTQEDQICRPWKGENVVVQVHDPG